MRPLAHRLSDPRGQRQNSQSNPQSSAPQAGPALWQRAVAGALVVTLTLSPLKVSIDQIRALRFGWSEAGAAPVADPYAPIRFRPSLTQTTAGVPVVNITAPNANGLSHNQYREFNVDAVGLILNNSLAGGGTLLGGSAAANPQLEGRPASLIVNEVTSSGGAFASRIGGAIEVFGAPAGVVIANPNGITCGGCAFVNTPRVTLTTGTPVFLATPNGAPASFDSAAALAFDVRGGRVGIEGIGIEGTVGRIDILAETIGVGAPLRANLSAADAGQINLVAGRQRAAEGADGSYALSANGAVNSASAIQAANPDNASVRSGFAIDAAALGALTAGQIKLIATAEGLGVRSDGALAASAGDLVITSNGEVRVGDVSAKQDVVIDARGDAATSGAVFAERDVRLSASGGFQAAGALSAGRNLDLQAGAAASLNGALDVGGDATLDAGAHLAQSGEARIGGAYRAAAASIALSGGTQADGDVTLDANGDLAFAGLATRGSLRLNAAGDIAGAGDALAAGEVSITSARGSIVQRGDLAAGGTLSVDAANDVSIAGAASAAEALSVVARNGDAALDGEVRANRTLSARAGRDLRADAALTAGENLALRAGGAIGLGGELASGAAIEIDAQQSIDTQALSALGAIRIASDAGAVNLGGKLIGGSEASARAGTSLHALDEVSALGGLSFMPAAVSCAPMPPCRPAPMPISAPVPTSTSRAR